MKNFGLLLVCIFTLMACEQKTTVDYAVVSGQIENVNGASVTIYKDGEKIKEIPLSETGTFADTLTGITSGYYAIGHGRERSSAYLTPGDDLNITINTEEFDESIAYQGTGATRNNYLAKKYLLDEELSGSYVEFYKLEETDFSTKLDALNEAKVALLNDTQNLSGAFIEAETKNLKFEHLGNLLRYESYHAYYAQKPDFKASEALWRPLENIDLYNAEDYAGVANYKSFVQNMLNKHLYDNDDITPVITEINEKGSQALKDDIAVFLSFQIAPSNEKNETLLQSILSMSTDDDLKENAQSKFEKVKYLAKGLPSPKFVDYENHKGGTTSLEELKGQYVYIDVWATWCAPCKREIPFLKEIEKDYHGKNIAFVSTSIDKAADHNKWVAMVKDKELGGIQLFADSDWSSPFVKEYAIEGIPRFILVDPEGNIVTADAPRPSDPKLVALFDELKI